MRSIALLVIHQSDDLPRLGPHSAERALGVDRQALHDAGPAEGVAARRAAARAPHGVEAQHAAPARRWRGGAPLHHGGRGPFGTPCAPPPRPDHVTVRGDNVDQADSTEQSEGGGFVPLPEDAYPNVLDARQPLGEVVECAAEEERRYVETVNLR